MQANRVSRAGEGGADSRGPAVAVSPIGVHRLKVGLVKLGKEVRIIAGGFKVEAVLFPVDHGTGHVLGILNFHLLVEAQPWQLGPVGGLRQPGKDQIDSATRIVEGHASDARGQIPRSDDHGRLLVRWMKPMPDKLLLVGVRRIRRAAMDVNNYLPKRFAAAGDEYDFFLHCYKEEGK